MKGIVWASLLLVASSLTAQQSQRPHGPTYGTPPIVPETQEPQSPEMTAQPLSSAEAQAQIQDKLATEPALSAASVKAIVDDSSIVLTGTVGDEHQHDLALRIANSYAGKRQIVDKIEVRGRA